MNLPAIPCDGCGKRDVPELEVVALTPSTDEHRYRCASCGKVIITLVLGEASEVDARKAELPGYHVEVTLDD